MNGTMSFVKLGKVMNALWKGCDKLARSVFDDLAEEGRRHYQMRLRKYLDGAGGGKGGGCGGGLAIATATANAKAKAMTKAATAKVKKPTAAAGGARGRARLDRLLSSGTTSRT
jgi:hypothetical protein